MIFCSNFLYKWMFEPMAVTFFFFLFNSVVYLYREYQVTQRVYISTCQGHIQHQHAKHIETYYQVQREYMDFKFLVNVVKNQHQGVCFVERKSHFISHLWNRLWCFFKPEWIFPPIHLIYQLSALSLKNIVQAVFFWQGRSKVVFSIEFQCVICI